MGAHKPRLSLIAAGGTISHQWDVQAGKGVPTLTAADLLAQTLLRLTVEVRCVDCPPPAEGSDHPADSLRLVRCLSEEINCGVDGVIVTHGTDTLEEEAYLIDECVSSRVPIVITGAMRPSWASGYDGIRNLENALRIVQAVPAEYGTLVTMNDEIFEAWSVYKADTGALDAFTPRRGAPYGRILGAQVTMTWRPIPRQRFLQFPQKLPDPVPIITVGVDDDATLLSQVSMLPLAGVVVASLAAGYVPAAAYRQLLALAERGTPVILCSSAMSGRTAEEYYYPRAYDELRTAGVIIEDWLSPRKARLRLMLSTGLQVPYVPFGQEFILPGR